MILGIDPGVTGGICVLDSSGKIRVLWAMPMKNKALDMFAIQGLFERIKPEVEAAGIEAIGYRRGQAMQAGVTAARNGAILECILTLSRIPYAEIHPQSWKRHFGIYAIKDKKLRKLASVKKAQELFKSQGGLFHRKLTDYHLGRVESALIAEYLRSTFRPSPCTTTQEPAKKSERQSGA